MLERILQRVLKTTAISATAISVTAIGCAQAFADSSTNVTTDMKGHQGAFLDKYCSKCHNAEDWAGSVAFDTMSMDNVTDDAKAWEHAVRKLRGQLMPPAGNPQPAAKDSKEFVSWMEAKLDQAAAIKPNPGHTVLHRLNRREYANTVRDLLNVQIDSTSLLPADDLSEGFDNIANVLQVSPSFLENYLAAARMVAVQAIGDRNIKPAGTTYFAKGTNQFFHIEGLPLGTRGGLAVTHNFPVDGEYELNIGDLAVALWVTNLEFENTLVATLDGKKFFQTTIGGEEDMKAIDQKQDPAVDAINKRLKKVRFAATAGPHKVAVAFIHRTFSESDDKLYQQLPGGGQDRVLRLGSFEVRGPVETKGLSDTASRKQIFTCYPQAANEEQPCAEKILSKLATQAYRRPLNDSDMKTLIGFYTSGSEKGGFENGIRQALTAMLANPFFLYRAEVAPKMVVAGETYPVNDLELAARLSFFLWSSTPDETLLKLAEQGRLHDRKVLEEQTRRLLADQRSQTLVTNFAFQWLNVGRLTEIDPDPSVFPYAADPRDDFRTELRLFIDSVFREDRPLVELLTADYTYLNERLALHYDINDVRGDRFRRVQLKNSVRFGLLGKGAVQMMTSYPNRTSPVLRGAWVLERINGTPPATPPPGVESLKDAKAGEKPHSLREMMAQHRTKPSCASCHGVLDPLGLAMENFDGVGKYRERDRLAMTAIDSSGQLPSGQSLNGVDDLRNVLAANSEQFIQNVTERMLMYALGRPLEYSDMPTVRSIVRASAQDNYRFSSLVLNIINSDPFQKRMIPLDASKPRTQTAQR